MIEEGKKNYCNEASEKLWESEEKFLDVLPKKGSNPSNEDILTALVHLWDVVDKQGHYHSWKLSQDIASSQSYCDKIGRKLLDDEWRFNAHQWKDKFHANEGNGPLKYNDPCCDLKKEQNEQSAT